MTTLDFIVLGLATWRVANMVAREMGPADIFERLRFAVGIRQSPDDPNLLYADNPNSVIANAILCIWCLSVYVGLVWSALYLLDVRLGFWLASPFALSAITCLLDEWRSRV